jgi:hypothetical protein
VCAGFEHLAKDVGTRRDLAVRTGHGPLGRDDPFDGGAIAGDPRPRELLLQFGQQADRIPFGRLHRQE